MLEALCRQSSTTLDIVHAGDGPPITQRTSGLAGLTHLFLISTGTTNYLLRFDLLVTRESVQPSVIAEILQ
jgi:hypothetical protein